MSKEIDEAKLRYENSKMLLERAAVIYDKDLNAYVAACLDKTGSPAQRPCVTNE